MAERTLDSRFSPGQIDTYYRETRLQYRGLWSNHALHYGYWDDSVSSHAEALHRLNEILANEATIGPGDYVLDAGCGWGGSAIWLALHRHCRSHGINLVPHQIENACKKASLFGLSSLAHFSVQDYHATNFEDETFDVVWAAESICHSGNKQAVFDETFRVLKSGGRLVVSDFLRSARPMTDLQERTLARWIHKWMVPDLATLSEVHAFLARSGFVAIESREATANVAPSSRRLFRIGLATGVPAIFFGLTGVHSAVQQANWKSSIYQYVALRNDTWRYALVSARKP